MATHLIELSIDNTKHVHVFMNALKRFFPLSIIECLNVERYLERPITRCARSLYGKALIVIKCLDGLTLDEKIIKSYINDYKEYEINLLFSANKPGRFFEVFNYDIVSFQKKYPDCNVIDYLLNDDDCRIVYV